MVSEALTYFCNEGGITSFSQLFIHAGPTLVRECQYICQAFFQWRSIVLFDIRVTLHSHICWYIGWHKTLTWRGRHYFIDVEPTPQLWKVCQSLYQQMWSFDFTLDIIMSCAHYWRDNINIVHYGQNSKDNYCIPLSKLRNFWVYRERTWTLRLRTAKCLLAFQIGQSQQ